MTIPEGQTHAHKELPALIDRVSALAWCVLPGGSLDVFNQRFGDYTGLYRHQLYGLQWKSAVHPDDIQQLEIWCQNINQSSVAGTAEVRLCRFDGKHRWFQIAAAPVHDELGTRFLISPLLFSPENSSLARRPLCLQRTANQIRTVIVIFDTSLTSTRVRATARIENKEVRQQRDLACALPLQRARGTT
jgi:PAS domain S-box-containing protein